MDRICVWCGEPFETKYSTKIYCKPDCSIMAKASRVNPRAPGNVKSFKKQGEMIGHARRMIQAGHDMVEILESIASTFNVVDTICEHYYQEAKNRVEILEGVRT